MIRKVRAHCQLLRHLSLNSSVASFLVAYKSPCEPLCEASICRHVITGSKKEDAFNICWLFSMVKGDQVSDLLKPISCNQSDAPRTPAIDLKRQKVESIERSWLRYAHSEAIFNYSTIPTLIVLPCSEDTLRAQNPGTFCHEVKMDKHSKLDGTRSRGAQNFLFTEQTVF